MSEELVDTIDNLRAERDEARSWARHGYEIGQRSLLWSDYGVAPKWLTEGWPNHFETEPRVKIITDLENLIAHYAPRREDARTCGCRGERFQVCDICQGVTGDERDVMAPEIDR